MNKADKNIEVSLRKYTAEDESNFVFLVTSSEVMNFVGGLDDKLKATEKFLSVLKNSEQLHCWAVVSQEEYIGHAPLFSSQSVEGYEKESKLLIYLDE